MDDAGDEAEQGQQNVDPELRLEADFEKHAERRQDDREDDLENVGC